MQALTVPGCQRSVDTAGEIRTLTPLRPAEVAAAGRALHNQIYQDGIQAAEDRSLAEAAKAMEKQARLDQQKMDEYK